MKDEKDIRREVEATMGLLDELHPVIPPAGLEERVMARLTKEVKPSVSMHRRQARIVWIAAAAAIVVAVNVFTLIQWNRKSHEHGNFDQRTDAIEDIRSEYSLDNNLY
ncbi:MAG: hypothetical protein U0176_06185 [Bacteroidia bacterium]